MGIIITKEKTKITLVIDHMSVLGKSKIITWINRNNMSNNIISKRYSNKSSQELTAQ